MTALLHFYKGRIVTIIGCPGTPSGIYVHTGILRVENVDEWNVNTAWFHPSKISHAVISEKSVVLFFAI